MKWRCGWPARTASEKPALNLSSRTAVRELMFHLRFARKRTWVATDHPDFDLLIGNVQRAISAAMLRPDEKTSTPAP